MSKEDLSKNDINKALKAQIKKGNEIVQEVQTKSGIIVKKKVMYLDDLIKLEEQIKKENLEAPKN